MKQNKRKKEKETKYMLEKSFSQVPNVIVINLSQKLVH